MTKQRWISMRLFATAGAVALCFFLTTTSATYGAAVVNWDFEDGVAGSPFTPVGQANGSGGSVDTVAGTLMRGWDITYGPSWTNVTKPRPGSTLSMRNAAQDGYVTEGALHNWTAPTWTIETSVMLSSLTGWNTLIGRDGSTVSAPESDFYLQENGIDDRFRFNFVTAGGERVILDGNYTPVANKWYGLAGTSDGTTFQMWLDDGNGYQQIGAYAYTGTDNAFRSSALNWTFGRGWYNGGQVDRINGFMDDIRFSNTALSPQDMIGIDPVPAPLSIQINKSTGAMSIKNIGTVPVTFDYYLIESAGNALKTTTWNSLSDQNIDAGRPADFNNNGTVDGPDLAIWKAAFGVDASGDANADGVSDGRDFLIWQRQYGQTAGAGESWDEAGGASTAKLAELFLNSASTLAPGQSFSLGNAYNTTVFGALDGDLTFKFGLAGSGLLEGGVAYLSSLSAVTAVPEPAGLALAAMAMLVTIGRRSKSC